MARHVDAAAVTVVTVAQPTLMGGPTSAYSPYPVTIDCPSCHRTGVTVTDSTCGSKVLTLDKVSTRGPTAHSSTQATK